MTDGISRQQSKCVRGRQRGRIGNGEQNGCVVGKAAPQKTIFSAFSPIIWDSAICSS